MSTSKPRPAKSAPRPLKGGATYRGVRVKTTGGQTRFSVDQIRQAVAAAIEKNAGALARRT
jgi:hypothetical protein